MSAVLTVRLNDEEAAALDRLARATRKSRSDLVRDALRQQALRETLRLLHEDLGPQARSAGWLTEEDILRDVS
jgi:predicted transcriptional regulator